MGITTLALATAGGVAVTDDSPAAATTIWAVLQPKPGGGGAFEVRYGAHTTGITFDDLNEFTVSFDQDVSRCAYHVTPRGPRGVVNHSVDARPSETVPNQVIVRLTEGTTGNLHRLPFQVSVTC